VPAPEPGPNRLTGIVNDIGYLGSLSIYRVALPNGTIVDVTFPNQRRPKSDRHAVGWDDEVQLTWEPSSAVLLTK